jgi:hypothetical protein
MVRTLATARRGTGTTATTESLTSVMSRTGGGEASSKSKKFSGGERHEAGVRSKFIESQVVVEKPREGSALTDPEEVADLQLILEKVKRKEEKKERQRKEASEKRAAEKKRKEAESQNGILLLARKFKNVQLVFSFVHSIQLDACCFPSNHVISVQMTKSRKKRELRSRKKKNLQSPRFCRKSDATSVVARHSIACWCSANQPSAR